MRLIKSREINQTTENLVNYIESKSKRMIEVKADFLDLWHSCIVYMAVGKDSVLYIGMSSQGLSRPFNKDHHVLSGISKEIISIQIFETDTVEDAADLERRLIREFHPKYNSRKVGKRTIRGVLNVGATIKQAV